MKNMRIKGYFKNFLHMKSKYFHYAWRALPYIWYGFLLIIPLILVFSLSFSEFTIGSPPYKPLWEWLDGGVFQLKISFANYIIVLKDVFYRLAFAQSFGIASLSTIFCLLMGYPMAYGIAKSRFRLIWLMLAVLPFLTSFLVRIYAWITLLSPQGLINHLFISCGLKPLALMNNPYAVIIGVVYSYLPFMIFPLYAVLEKMDPRFIEAAYDLGCRPLSAFWRITVPLSRAGIVAGSSLVFIPAMGEYLIPEFLGGPTSLTIGRLLWLEFFTNRDWPVAATLAVVIIVLLLVPIFLFEKLQTSLGDHTS